MLQLDVEWSQVHLRAQIMTSMFRCSGGGMSQFQIKTEFSECRSFYILCFLSSSPLPAANTAPVCTPGKICIQSASDAFPMKS